MKKRKIILSLLFIMFVFSLTSLSAFKIKQAKAESINSISLSDNWFIASEAEEYSYIPLSASGDINSLLPFSVGFTENSGTAQREINYTTLEENKIPVVMYNDMLCLQLTMLKNEAYDSGKTLNFTIYSLDTSKYFISNTDTAELTFKDKNPDGFVSIISEDKTVFENDGQTFFTVQVSPNYFGTTVNFTYSGSAVLGTDFNAPSSVYIDKNVTEYNVPVTLLDNSDKQERPRVINIYLSSCSEGSEIAAIPNNTSVTIKDDESCGKLTFLSESAEVVEYDGDYMLVISRKGGTEGEIAFDLSMTSTAKKGKQYSNDPSGGYTFEDGEASKIIRLKLIDDKTYTGEENFIFKITTDDTSQLNISEITLTRHDSVKTSEIYALNSNGEYSFVRTTQQGLYYSLGIFKTAGAGVSFKIAITMDTWDITTANGYTQSYITVSDSDLSAKSVYTLDFSRYTDGTTAGNVNAIHIRFYDFSEGVTMNGLTDYTLNIEIIDLVDYGVYRLETPTRDGNIMTFSVSSVYPSLRVVNFTLTFINKATNETLDTNNFQISSYTVFQNLTFDVTPYLNTVDTVVAVLSSSSLVTIDGSPSYEFNINKGSGGTVGLWNNLTVYENSFGYLTLIRNFANTAIDVPIYIKNEGVYFDNSAIVGTAHFDIGQYSVSVKISVPNNDIYSDIEINYLYIEEGANYYVTTGLINSKSVSKEIRLTIYNDDDYGKAGFAQSEITAVEGEEFTVSLVKDGGLDTPVGFYVIETNLPDFQDLNNIIITNSGGTLTFTYDDETYFKSSALGYVKLGLITYVLDTNLNKGGIISGKDTITITFTDNDTGAYIGFCDKYGNALSGSGLETEVFEKYSGANRGIYYLSLYSCENYENNFSFQVYAETREGSTAICLLNSNFNIKKGGVYSFDYYFNYTPESGDNVFYIKLRVLSSNGKTLENSSILKITSKNTVPITAITAQESCVSVNETQEQAEIVLNRNYLEYALTLNILNYAEILETLSDFKIYLKGARIDGNEFTWQAGESTLNLVVTWSDNTNYTGNNLISLQIAQIGNNPFTFGGASINIIDDEINARIKWSDEALFYNELNPYELYPSDGNTPFSLGLDLSELSAYAVSGIWQNGVYQTVYNGYYIYYKIEAADQTSAEYFDSHICSASGRLFISGENAKNGYAILKEYVKNDGIYLPSALYRITLTGATYGINISDENSTERTVYFRISDKDSEITLSSYGCVYEKDDSAEITLKRLTGRDQTVTVSLSLDASADAAGFILSENCLTFSAGETVKKIFLIAPSEKSDLSDVTITASYSSETIVSAEKNCLLYVLEVEDYTFTVQESIALFEGLNVSVKISRSSGTGTGSVNYAVLGMDSRVNNISGQVVFSDGETEKYVTLTALNDNIVNKSSDLVFTLSDAVGGAYTIIGGNVSVNVIDNDTVLSSVKSSGFNESLAVTLFADFDGDGLGDVFGIMENGTVLIYFNEGAFYTKNVYSFKIGLPKSLDFGKFGKKGYGIALLYENGIGIISVDQDRGAFYQYNETQCKDADEICSADINGDGLAEICYTEGIKLYSFSVDTKTLFVSSEATLISVWTGMSYCTVEKYGDILAQMGYYKDGALPRKVTVRLYDGLDIRDYTAQMEKSLSGFKMSGIFHGDKLQTYAVANYGYFSEIGTYLIIDDKKVLELPSNLTSLYAANIDSDNTDEIIYLAGGKIYIVKQYKTNGGYRYSVSEPLDISETVTELFVSDLYGTGVFSVYYKIGSKVYLIENPYNLTVISFAISSVTVNDTDGYADVTVTRSGSLNVVYSIGIATVDGTALGGIDFKPIEKTLTFGIRETSKTIRIYFLKSDSLPSDTRTFALELFSGNANIKFSISSLEINIIDTDRSGVAEFENIETKIAENNKEAVTVAVTRTKGTYNLIVDYEFIDSLYAKNGENYNGLNGTLTFAADEYIKYITFIILDDDYYNGTFGWEAIAERYFTIRLKNARSSYDYGSSGFSAQIGENSEFKVYITDNETFAIHEAYNGEYSSWDTDEKIDFNGDGFSDSYTIGNNKITVIYGGRAKTETELSATFANLLSKYNVTTNRETKAFYSSTLNQFVLVSGSDFYTFRVLDGAFISCGEKDTITAAANISDYFADCDASVYSVSSLLNRLSDVGDIDGDGQIDFFFTPYYYLQIREYSSSGVRYYLNERGIQFAAALSGGGYKIDVLYTYYAGINFKTDYPLNITIRDLNGDNTDDIICHYSDKGILYSLSFEGVAQSFEFLQGSEAYTYTSDGSFALSFIKADTNGIYDLVFIDYASGGYILYVQKSNGSFIKGSEGKIAESIIFGRYYSVSYIADNETGNLYLRYVSANSSAALSYYLNGDLSYAAILNIYYSKLQFKTYAMRVVSVSFDEDAGEGYITIYNPSGIADTVNYYYEDGTAQSGHDYSISGSSVTFNEGEYYRTVKVTLYSDSYFDGNKYFMFYIYNSSQNQLITSDCVKITITDNEEANDIAGLNTVYYINKSFSYTALVNYDIARLDIYSGGTLISSVNSKSFTLTYYTKGMQNLVVIGYNSAGQRVLYKTLSANILDTSGLDISIDMPKILSSGDEVEIEFTVMTNTDNASESYAVESAEITFTDPFTLEKKTIITDSEGKAYYSMLVTSDDYGAVTLTASVKSYLVSSAGVKVATVNLTAPDGKIMGYILLPDGNIGVSGIKVRLGNKEAVTNQNGYFEIAAVSGYSYDLTINPDKENSFYNQAEAKVNHSSLNSIISVSLEENDENSLTFNVSYFYNNYFGSYTESEIYESEYTLSGICKSQKQYNLPAGDSEYKSFNNMTFTAGYATPGTAAELFAKVPSNTNSYKVQTRYRTREYARDYATWTSWGNWIETGYANNLKSETKIYFSVNSLGALSDIYKNLEFVTCDENGNTTGVLDNVTASNNVTTIHRYTNYLYGEYPSGKEKVTVAKYGNPILYENYLIILTIRDGDIEEGDKLYIRRLTSNDVVYYYTGIEFGRSVAELVRDDVAKQFSSVVSEQLPSSMELLAGLAFGFDLSKLNYDMKSSGTNRVTVYLGYAASTYELDCETEKIALGGVLSLKSNGLSYGANIKGGAEFYFGGIFEMFYDTSEKVWKYVSGQARLIANESLSFRLTFEVRLFAIVSGYGYVEVGTSLSANMTMAVEDGILNINGTTTSEYYLEIGQGISITIAKGEVWGRASGEVVFHFGDVKGTELNITFSGGMTVYFLWFDYRMTWLKKTFSYDYTYSAPEEPVYSMTLQDIENNDYSNYTVQVDSNGVIQGAESEVTEIGTTVLAEQSNINSRPQLLSFADKKMMVYSQTVIREGKEYSALFYKIKTDDRWSVPSLVYSGINNISEYSLTLYEGMPAIAFSYAQVDGDIASQYQKTEIAAALFDGENFNIYYITSDYLPDYKPKIASDGSNMIITFVKTYRTDYDMDMTVGDLLFSSNEKNYMMYSVFNGVAFESPKVMRRGIYNMTDCDMQVTGGNAYFMMLADKDGVITTSSDTEVLLFKYDFLTDIWTSEENITNNSVAETAIKIIEANGKPVYFWLNKYGINMKTDDGEAKVINTREQGTITYFTAKAYLNNIVLAWTEDTVNSDEGAYNSIYFLIIDVDGNIGRRKALASTSDIILDFDIAAENGEISYVYSQSHIEDSDSANSEIVYKITGGTVYYAVSASAENVYTASGRLRKNTSETFFFDITNFGDTIMTNLIVAVRRNNADGEIIYSARIESLNIGESKTLSFAYVVPEGMYGIFITAEQGTYNALLSAAVSNADEKSVTLYKTALKSVSENYLDYVHLSVRDGEFNLTEEKLTLGNISVFQLDDEIKLLINVINTGDTDSSGTIRVRVNTGVKDELYAGSFETVSGQTKQILVSLKLKDLYKYANEENFISFIIDLSADSGDADMEKFADIATATLPTVYTVKFNSNGGSSVEDITAYGTLTAFPENPSRKGYEFKGWYLDEECLEDACVPMTLLQNTTLYAKWEKTSNSYSFIWIYFAGGGVLIAAAAVFIVLYLKKKRVNVISKTVLKNGREIK